MQHQQHYLIKLHLVLHMLLGILLDKIIQLRLAATRHEAVALELSSRECGAANPTRDSMVTATLDRLSNGRNADFFSQTKTDSDTRCQVGSRLTQQVGPTRKGTAGYRMPLVQD